MLQSPATAAGQLREALNLWRGMPLEEFSDEPFAQPEIPRLEEQRLNALSARIEADLVLGRHAAIVGELESLIRQQPLHEGFRRQLILSLYRSERQAEALEAFRHARDTFAEELGIELGRTLRDLEYAILSQDASLDLTPPVSASLSARSPTEMQSPPDGSAVSPAEVPALPRIVWNVPARNPHFSGRSGLLAEIRAGFTTVNAMPSVQALHGLGGVGKTQAAIEYAHRYADDCSVVWWVDAEQPVFMPDQFSRLGSRLGLPARESGSESVEMVLEELSRRPGWLLIFDNAENPSDIAGYRPNGRGHILVTSRFPGWGELGSRVQVDVPDRGDIVAMFRGRLPSIPGDVADALATELGDLPLAAAQAAAYLEQTGMEPAEYLRRFRTTQADFLAKGEVLAYKGRVNTAWELSLQRLSAVHPWAVPLLELTAFLAPDPVPMDLFAAHPELIAQLHTAATGVGPDTFADAVGAAVSYSMLQRFKDTFHMHRLVQAVIRNRLGSERAQLVAAQTVALLAASHPGDPNDPANWARFARLAPHVLTAGRFSDDDPAGRQLLLATVAYLNVRGDPRASRRIAGELYGRWRRVLGADHPDSLSAAAYLSSAMAWLGEHDAARSLGRDTLDRSRHVLGPDHPNTLRLATNLAFALAWLGESDQACILGQDSLARAGRVLGSHDHLTLRLAANLTFALVMNNRADEALLLGEETVERSRAHLGPDHPVTLVSAGHLALAMAWLGRDQENVDLTEETLRRSRAALGRDHPTTLASAAHLTIVLVWRGEVERARDLGNDTLERSHRVLGTNHLISLVAAAATAFALADQGEAHDAGLLGDETLHHAQEILGPDHLITLLAATALTVALAGTGATDQALTLGRDTLRRCEGILGEGHLLTTAISRTVSSLVARGI